MNSKKYALDLWQRSEEALRTAEADLSVSFDAAASRAYYAVFYAVSALFALEGKEFVKHSAVHTAVHRDLVKSGRWSSDLGKDYSRLLRLRETGDYGGGRHVQEEEARAAVSDANHIRNAVIQACPDLELIWNLRRNGPTNSVQSMHKLFNRRKRNSSFCCVG